MLRRAVPLAAVPLRRLPLSRPFPSRPRPCPAQVGDVLGVPAFRVLPVMISQQRVVFQFADGTPSPSALQTSLAAAVNGSAPSLAGQPLLSQLDHAMPFLAIDARGKTMMLTPGAPPQQMTTLQILLLVLAAAGALLCICLACHRAKGLFQYDSDEEDDLMGGGKRGKKGRKARKYDDDDDEQELSASPPKKVLELQADVLEG